MVVKEIMTKEVITFSPEASLKEVGKIFKEKRISGAPIVNKDGILVGIVTLTDLLRILDQIYRWRQLERNINKGGLKLSQMREEEKSKAKVRDIMTKDVYTVTEDNTLDEAMRLMFNKKVHTIPVVKDGRVVGVIGKRDIISICF